MSFPYCRMPQTALLDIGLILLLHKADLSKKIKPRQAIEKPEQAETWQQSQTLAQRNHKGEKKRVGINREEQSRDQREPSAWKGDNMKH